VNNHDKHKFKDKRKKSNKKDHRHGKKTWAREKMKRSSDIESDSEDTSSSSSDEDEEDDKKKKKKKKLAKYLNGLYVTGLSLKDDFFGMARNSSNKRSQKDASDLDSEDEVCDELSSFARRIRSWLTCFIIAITCLERLRNLGRSLDLCLRMLGLEWLS
jgi:hypothetical protein